MDKKIIYINNDNPAIYCQNNLFGFKHAIYIYDNFFTKNNSFVFGGQIQYLCKGYELNNGEQYLNISEMEIFQIKCD